MRREFNSNFVNNDDDDDSSNVNDDADNNDDDTTTVTGVKTDFTSTFRTMFMYLMRALARATAI